MIDNFNYNGIVRIQIKNDKYVIHNEGLSDLFKLLAKALAGYNTSSERPTRLKVVDNQDNNLLTVSYLNLFANTYLQLEEEPEFVGYYNAWAARYLCYLPGYQIDNDKVENLTGGYFIITNSNNIELAKVQMTPELITSLKSLDDTNQALIEWNLLVTNGETSANTNTNVI